MEMIISADADDGIPTNPFFPESLTLNLANLNPAQTGMSVAMSIFKTKSVGVSSDE